MKMINQSMFYTSFRMEDVLGNNLFSANKICYVKREGPYIMNAEKKGKERGALPNTYQDYHCNDQKWSRPENR